MHLIGLTVLRFYSKTGFWLSYCQISTDIDKILRTPIVVRNTLHLWADLDHLDRDRLAGGSRPNENDFFFGNTCNAHIETTDRLDFGGKPSRVVVRTGAIVKNSGFF